MLGNFESANLLDAKASFSTHLRLSDNAVNFGANPVLDSAVIILSYAGYYGDTTIEMNIQVEQLSEEIYDTTTYFSDEAFSTSPFSSPLEYSFFPTQIPYAIEMPILWELNHFALMLIKLGN